MVYRIYVEKKPGFDGEAQSLRNELVSLLGADTPSGKFQSYYRFAKNDV